MNPTSNEMHCGYIAKMVKEDQARRVRAIVNATGVKPKLLVLSVGSDPASERYMRNKAKDCEEVGFIFEHVAFDEKAKTQEVISVIERSDADGIILQLPVPQQIDVQKVTAAIPILKDVDCFKPENVGNIVLDPHALNRPCTPAGIIYILDEIGFDLRGAKVCVLGRSNIVGKPLANMLINEGATVTVCNSYSQIEEPIKAADVIISAVGKYGIIQPSMVSSDQIVIDVGINIVNGKLCGDMHEDCKSIVKLYTPVPGGVGLMTRAMLIRSVATAYLMQH